MSETGSILIGLSPSIPAKSKRLELGFPREHFTLVVGLLARDDGINGKQDLIVTSLGASP